MKLFIALSKNKLTKSLFITSSGFGKPMERNEGESINEYMGRVIKHLIKDKGYSQAKAVAAAYVMVGHPDMKKRRK